MHTHIGNPYKILEDKLMITWFILGVWTNFVTKWTEHWYLKKDQEICLYLYMIETGKIFR